MAQNSFVLYTDYKQHIDLLSVEEKGLLFDALFRYVEGEEVQLEGMAMMAFSFIKAQLDRDTEKYEKTCEQRRKAGSEGGKAKQANAKRDVAKQANATFAKRDVANQADTDTDTDNDTDTVTDTENETVTDTETENEILRKEKPSKKKLDLRGILEASDIIEPVKETCREWLQYKSQIKDQYKSEIGFQRLLKQVSDAVDEYGQAEVIRVINLSMSNGYRGIVWEKLKHPPRNEPQSTEDYLKGWENI